MILNFGRTEVGKNNKNAKQNNIKKKKMQKFDFTSNFAKLLSCNYSNPASVQHLFSGAFKDFR